jgi:pimeloyl-ACP methyl ester carboxylesterase
MSNYSLIALHGNGGGGFRFERSRPYYPARIRFSAPTLPGFAGEPPDPTLQTVTDYAHRLHDHIQAQPGPRVLLGTGIGGAIVLEYLQHHTDALQGVILHAPVGTRLNTRLFPQLMALPGMTALGQAVFASPITRPVLRRLLFSHPIPDAYINRFFDEYGRCDVFGQMFNIITADWFAGLKPASVPAVLLWGEREKVLSVNQLDDYRVLVPTHTIRIIPDWDHFPMIETPQTFAQVTTELADHLVKTGTPPPSKA